MEPKTKLPKGGSSGKKSTIPVEIKAHGFEDAAEKIELVADAIDSMPATVNIKAKDCEVNVHTTNIIETQNPPIKECAPKGFYVADGFKPKPDYEPEKESIERFIKKLAPADRDQELIMLARIKNRCKCRSECEGCWYNKSKDPDIRACILSGGIPENWLI